MIERYKSIFDNSNEGLLVVNHLGIIETVNPKLVEMFGYSSSKELEGEKLEVLIPSDLRKKHVDHRDGYIKKPTSRPMGLGKALMGQKKQGNQFPVEISLSHFKENGELKINAFVIDITERVKIENEILTLNNELESKVMDRTKEINEQNKLLKSIAENFPNGNIYVINKNYIIEWADGKLLRNIGLTDQSLVGISFKERLPSDIKNIITNQLDKLFKGNTIKFEIEDKNKHFLIYGVSLSEENNGVEKALLVEMDITKEKNNELNIEKNLKKEKELNELKSRFVAMASHEFRTPLSTIDSSATLIDKYKEDQFKEKRQSHVDRIKRTVSNLTMILNDFLSLEKLESGKTSCTFSEVNINNLINEIIEEVGVIKKVNQFLVFKPESKQIIIQTDFNILKNCILNLLSNACKYSPEKSQISIETSRTKDILSITIKDNGIGIPKQDQERLFTRFHRAGNVTNIEGTGLGLNIVKRYLESLKGQITFKSEINVGSEFTIILPFQIQ